MDVMLDQDTGQPDFESAAPSPPVGAAGRERPATLTTVRGLTERPMRMAGVIAVLAVAGGGVGGGTGLALPTDYEVRMAAQIDHVLVFPSWESNQATARFSQTVQRDDVQQAAAAAAGVTVSAYRDVSALGQDGSPIVDVELVVDDPSIGPAAMEALVDEALRTLARSDLVPVELVVEESTPDLAAVEAELEGLWSQAGQAPGTNLGELYNRSTSDLAVKQAELPGATEDWIVTQLTAEIAVLEERVATLEPVVTDWYRAESLRNDLDARLSPAQERLGELEVGLGVLDAGGHRGPASVTELSRRTVVGRFAAGGAALGIAAGLGLLAWVALRRPRAARR